MQFIGRIFNRVCIYGFFCFQIFYLQAEAHWHGYQDKLATHDYMIQCAIKFLAEEGSPFSDLLKPYETTLIQGTRDADLRANGIYSIDCGCKDPTENEHFYETGCCLKSKLTCNDIAEISDFFYGYHGYRQFDGQLKSFNVSDSRLVEVRDKLQRYENCIKISKVVCDKRDGRLYRMLPGTTVEKKLQALRNDMLSSDAAVLAEIFFQRAIDEWRLWESECQERYRINAMYNLGMALHMVQDVSNPEHTRLKSGETNSKINNLFCKSKPYQNGYEGYVWECYLEYGKNTIIESLKVASQKYPFYGDKAEDSTNPSQIVIETAQIAYSWGENALDPSMILNNGEQSSASSFRLGVMGSVQMIRLFFQTIFYNKIGPNAVWIPSISVSDNLDKLDKCRAYTDSPPEIKKCLANLMRQGLASEDAIEFMKLTGGEGWMEAFKIDCGANIAITTNPFMANDNYRVFIVNNNPKIIEVFLDNEDILKLTAELKNNEVFKSLKRKNPNTIIWPKGGFEIVQKLDRGGRRLIFIFNLLDGCHACGRLGNIHIGYDFDNKGNFSGKKLVGVSGKKS